jgi:hypothetical protein
VLHPGDFSDGHIDYGVLEDHLKRIVDRYRCSALTFDGYESAFLIQRLREHVRTAGHVSRACVIDDVSTSAGRIWQVWESTKVALNAGVAHAAYHELLHLELSFLSAHNERVECPTTGLVTTKDVAIGSLSADRISPRIRCADAPKLQVEDPRPSQAASAVGCRRRWRWSASPLTMSA